ncbi:GGDEF domain-containing protein [Pleomorphochaeta sp. DL1XJH-081]|uniref:GGDEF domain-containing protein n=1 Tax=Pleomorphochaeta sp. DL1XJH-081 TaxID=3409690 RepID=UPI003BB73157
MYPFDGSTTLTPFGNQGTEKQKRSKPIQNPYDLSTIAFFGLLFHGMFAIVFFSLWLRNRSHVKGLGYWTLNLMLHTVGRIIAIIDTGPSNPLVVSIGNIATLVGAFLFLFGLASFTETDLNKRNYLILAILISILILTSAFTVENQLYRSAIHGGASAFVSFQYLRIIWKKRKMNTYYATPFSILFFIYTLFVGIFILRTLGDIFAILQGVELQTFDSNAIRTSNLFALIALTGVNFLTLLLVNGKLLSDLADEGAAKTTMLERLRIQAHHDSLTDILNRSGLENILDSLFFAKRDEPFMICLIDIDNFKDINDTYGHDMGDRVLIQLANILSSITRTEDHVGRWGGDEFLVILPKANSLPEEVLPQRIHAAVGDYDWSKLLALPKIEISISLGYTCYRYPESKRTLLKRCDNNLYRAKNSGKNSARGELC